MASLHDPTRINHNKGTPQWVLFCCLVAWYGRAAGWCEVYGRADGSAPGSVAGG